MDDRYENVEEYNPNKEHEILIVFVWLLICLAIQSLIQ